MGLTAGLLQAAINQGEFWLRGELSSRVVLKSLVSPIVGFTLVLLSAAATCVDAFNKGPGHEG